MQEVVIDRLSSSSIPVDIKLSSSFPEIDGALYKDILIVKSRRRNLPLSLLKTFLLLILPYSLARRYASLDKELSNYLEANLVIDLSGDMLTEDYGPHIALSHAFPLIFSRLLHRPYAIIGQSVGPFHWLLSVYRSLLKSASIVTVREGLSRDYLKSIGVTETMETADLGFLLSPSLAVTSADPNIPVLGIAPSGLLFSKFSAAIDSRDPLVDLCDIINRFAIQNQWHVLLVPHVLSPSGSRDDNAACQIMKSLITVPCTVLDSGLSPAETKSAIASTDILIAFRMHAAIAGLDTEVPTLGISYSHKTQGLFQKLGMLDWVIDNDAAMFENIEKKLDSLKDRRAEVQAHLSAVLPVLRASAEENIELIEKVLVSDS